MAVRSAEQRRADALAKLTAHNGDCWVASADDDGAHLVPLSYAWDGQHLVLAIDPSSRTALNIIGSGRSRVALGHTRDVVMIDAVLVRTVPLDEAGSLADLYAGQTDWDPRAGGGWPFTFVLLRPERVQVWREADEIAGRTVMRNGDWLA